LLDEPTAQLDVVTRADLLDKLDRRRREHQTTMLYVTHDLDLASKLCDQKLVLRDGRISS
jgi:ABC-type glutathione transport system ATPase component